MMAACGGSTTAEEEAQETQPAETAAGGRPQATGTLSYYNWADYVNPETYTAFTKETGVKVNTIFANAGLEERIRAEVAARH